MKLGDFEADSGVLRSNSTRSTVNPAKIDAGRDTPFRPGATARKALRSPRSYDANERRESKLELRRPAGGRHPSAQAREVLECRYKRLLTRNFHLRSGKVRLRRGKFRSIGLLDNRPFTVAQLDGREHETV